MICFTGPRAGKRVVFVGLSGEDFSNLLAGEMLETVLEGEHVCVLLRETDADLAAQIEAWYPGTGRVIEFLAAEHAQSGEPEAACSAEEGGWKKRPPEPPLPPHISRDLWPAQGPRTTVEAGAGFAPGELRRPDACDPAEDGAERVMQAAETWWGRQ